MQQQIFIRTDSPDKKDSNSFSWSDFFSFRRMITLQVIQVIYFIVAGLITAGAITTMFFEKDLPAFMNGGFLMGIAILGLGNILWRICCELIIVFFRINKTLPEIDGHTKEENLSHKISIIHFITIHQTNHYEKATTIAGNLILH